MSTALKLTIIAFISVLSSILGILSDNYVIQFLSIFSSVFLLYYIVSNIKNIKKDDDFDKYLKLNNSERIKIAQSTKNVQISTFIAIALCILFFGLFYSFFIYNTLVFFILFIIWRLETKRNKTNKKLEDLRLKIFNLMKNNKFFTLFLGDLF